MSTIRGWWEEDRTQTQKFYTHEIGQLGEAPYFCEPWIVKTIITQHVNSPAMWSIFQIQELLGMSGELRRENPNEERINVPANPKHYWRYRMHIGLEDLLKEEKFNEELKELIVAGGRG
jgi:4-alpha-glucanotransferase